MKNKKSMQGYLLIFLTGILWGTIGIFVKEMSLRGADALYISFVRVLFAFLVMFLLTVKVKGIKALRIGKKQLFYCGLLGVICQGIYNIFYSYAVTLIGVSLGAVLLNLAPVITMLFSVWLFSEKMSAWKVLAIFLNVLGCVLTVTGGDFTFQTISLVGLFCGVGAGVSYALTAILGKFATEETDAYVSSTYSYLFAALFLIVPGRPWMISWDGVQLEILGLGLLLAVIPTAIAYVMYYKGLSLITETSKVPVVASGETVVAALLGVLLYREKLNGISVLGIGLVLLSILCINFKKTRM